VAHPDLRVAPAADLETGRIASRLRELPMVSEAVVTPAPDGRRLTAYLLPAAAALDGDAGEVARRHVEGWRAGSGPAGERSDLVERIRALEPDQILEIGWGRGPSLPGLRAWCDSYLERRPDDLSGLAAERFDVVVLHSVVPSFPGAAYLARVLDAAIRVAAPHGAVVLGGLRHHGLREAYHTSVELSRAVDMLPIDELRRRVRHALAHDPELSVDPRYFTGYAAGRPEIGAVEVMPARGRDDTTLTQYRYDVVLRLGTPPPEPETEWHDWRRDVLSRDEIEWLLDHAGGNAVGVCGIPDQRVAMDVEAARLLAGADPPGTAGRLRSAAGQAASGMDPEELSQLAGRKGWSVAVTWSAYRADGSLHARFCRTPELAAGVALATAGDEDPPPVTLGPLTSTPLRPALVEELERLAAGVLPETVPEYAGMTRVVVVDELPRAASGRVDETALPVVADEPAGPATAGPVPPRTADELRLARIWEEVLGVTSVDVRTSFFDLGGDSMLAIRLIDEASRALGRELPLAVLLQQPTIEGMAAALSARPGPWTPLVEINPGPGTPFFCVHPAGGNVICYAELARLVRPQPFYALQARGVEGDDPPHDDIPAMATRYLQDVRARQPTGPYLLGGWSMGGLIAYEMAHQLAAAGEPVGMVVMVDTPTPDLAAELPDQAAALARLLDGVVPVDLTQLRAMPARERLRFVLAEAERAHVIPPGMDPDRAQHLFEVFAAHLRAVDSYRPRPYGGPVRLLRATHSGIDVPDYGWGRLLGGQWEVIEVPGNHDTVVWPPNVQRVAEVLRAQLR
jgi:thioesterase domain-containing protein/acyl carrier protein